MKSKLLWFWIWKVVKKSLKTPKGQSESVYRRRTDNTMVRRNSTKRQTTIYSIFSLISMFCRLLFVLLDCFFWPLCCLFFFDIRILITALISSNSSNITTTWNKHYTTCLKHISYNKEARDWREKFTQSCLQRELFW